MTEPLTVHVLREIRDEIVASRHESKKGLDQLRLELTSSIDSLREEVTERLDVLTFRAEKTEEAILGLATQHRFIVRSFETLSRRDRRLENEVGDLRGRLEVVEKKLASG